MDKEDFMISESFNLEENNGMIDKTNEEEQNNKDDIVLENTKDENEINVSDNEKDITNNFEKKSELKEKDYNEDIIEYSDNKPYQLIDILQSTSFQFTESPESRITCIESWELNLYIGTNLGEIIHLYKIDDISGYIQISKQAFSSSSTSTPKPIKKIVVLPEVTIALIYCGSTVSGYLLPELSPANIGKAKDVSDISIDWKDLKIDDNKHNWVTKKEDYFGESFVKVTIFTKKSIKLLRIFHDSIRLHKELQYNDIITGLQISNFSIVSNLINYDLIDMTQSQKIFLFPISTTTTTTTKTPEVELKPIIRYVKKNELLLVCGGLNINEPAIGMFINLNGDIIRGTLTFESYPTSIEVDYPYINVILKNKNINIYSIYDQTKLQEIKFNNNEKVENIKLHESSKIFEIKDLKLANKITLSPIISIMDNEEIERIAIESDNALKKSVCLSSCILYETSGKYIKIMKPISKYERWMKIYEKCNNDNENNNKDENKYLKIYDKLIQEYEESNLNKFLITLIGFFTLEFKMFNQLFEIWITNFKYLDPRLMIYIFNNNKEEEEEEEEGKSNGIYGSVWTYEILFSKVEELRKVEKDDEMKDFFKLYLNTCLTIDFKEEEHNIIKSIEIALIKFGIENKENLENIINEIKYSTNEIIEILLLNKKYYLLSKFYAKLKDHRQLLYYWKGLINKEFEDEEFNKNFKDKNKSLQYLINYIITNCYFDNEIINKYSEWLLKEYPKFGLKLIIDERIKLLDINDIKIINMLNEGDIKDKGNDLKLEYLEYIFENKNEKQFLGDLILIYLNKMIEMYEGEEKGIKRIINKSLDEYLNMKIDKKPSIYQYWKIIKDNELKKYLKFIKYHDKLYKYLEIISINMKSVLEQKVVLNICKEKIIDSDNNNNKIKDKFPMISLMIMFKFEDYNGIIEELINIKDYSTADEFAVSLKLQDIEDKNGNNNNNNNNGINDNNSIKSKKSTLLIKDEINEDKNENNNKDIIIIKEGLNKRISEELLKKIFDYYIENKETKLINKFLNKYDLLNDINYDGEDLIIDRMNKFNEILNKLPNNFPIDKLKTFLMNNLIEFKDYNDEINEKKILIKVELNRLKEIERGLNK
ncbi:hypothetical protein C6P42_004059 [Pichia californica]|nr:hypothetical protein C6P42_004059 [[Candida] californica]